MKLSTTMFAAALACALFACGAQAQDTIKIGWAISEIRARAPGAAITTLPNYQVWVKDVNDAGGLNVGGKKMKIEVIEYDDRSNSEELIKAIERLATQDKVDFILAPWSTGMNLAAAPIFNKYGYPHLAVTANSNRSPEMVKRWPNLTFWLGLPSEIIDGLVTTLDTLRKDGKIGNKVAMAAVGDQFGIEQSTAAREGFKKAGFELVYDKSYPFGTQDLQPIIKDAQAGNPDVFVAFSYPPDTIGLTDQSKIAGFSPEGVLRRRRHRVPAVQAEVRRQRRRRDGHRRLERRPAEPQEIHRASQGGRGPRAGPLGEPDDLREPSGAAAGDREGRQARQGERSSRRSTPARSTRSSARSSSRTTTTRASGRSANGRATTSTASRRSRTGARAPIVPKPAWQ